MSQEPSRSPLCHLSSGQLLWRLHCLKKLAAAGSLSTHWITQLEAEAGLLSTTRLRAMATEEARQRTQEAEANLHDFVRQAWPVVEPFTSFIDGWHVRGICRHLEAVTRGEINNLLINVPPGCCKSLLCSVFWPAWTWLRQPSARWLFASYNQELSTRDSLRCRYVIESDWYQRQWGDRFRLAGDQNQKIRFDNDQRGWRLATSVGGRATGEHPDFIVVDDPHKVQEAQSELERQAAIDWWDGTISSRGQIRGVRRVVVMQRLHERDLSAHLLEKPGWCHICLPMEYEPDRMPMTPLGWSDERAVPGELLWPEAFRREIVEGIKIDMGTLRAAGQLQQRPAPLGGSVFRREWFPIVNECPAHGRAVRYWDKAATAGAGDYSAGVLIVLCDGVYYVADVVRGRWGTADRNRVMRQTTELDAQRFPDYRVWIEQEPGSGGKESAEHTLGLLAGFPVFAERVTGDKLSRSGPWEGQCAAGNVRLVGGSWNREFIEEHCAFPHGSHDDQVDAAAGAFSKLTRRTRRLLASGGAPLGVTDAADA